MIFKKCNLNDKVLISVNYYANSHLTVVVMELGLTNI